MEEFIMNILNQDHDLFVTFTDSSRISYEAVIYSDIFFGYNLLIDNIAVGTFETSNEAIQEAINIMDSEQEYYIVSGYEIIS